MIPTDNWLKVLLAIFINRRLECLQIKFPGQVQSFWNLILCKEMLTISADESSTRDLKSVFIQGVFHRYLELRECKPRLSKLRSILGESLFAGLNSISKVGPKTDELLSRIQCSEKELEQGTFLCNAAIQICIIGRFMKHFSIML